MPIIQLQPKEIATFWDGIKLSLARSGDISAEKYEHYMNNALSELLSGRMSCWIVLEYIQDNMKQIHAMIITSIRDDLMFGDKTLQIEGLYGFRKVSDQLWLDVIEQLKIYARNVDCSCIRAVTANERAKQIAGILGFTEFAIAYLLEV